MPPHLIGLTLEGKTRPGQVLVLTLPLAQVVEDDKPGTAGMAGSGLGGRDRRIVIKSCVAMLKQAGVRSAAMHLRHIECEYDGRCGQTFPPAFPLAG